jgi:hypothetical protein
VSDPYRALGVPPEASAEELTSARRRLALTLHPDLGGDEAAMQALNAAYDEAVRRLDQRRVAEPAGPADRPSAASSPAPSQEQSPTRLPTRLHGVQFDQPSFTIDVLPVEAFEALLIVAAWMGEVLVDDPPYLLEVFLRDPSPCWCRLDLVPDAGATTVSLVVAGVDGDATPDPERVRDEWIVNLNRL